ncbi:MAG: site-specific integrase [Phascolarctobacterium sp.]|nr:site-specific integrase [Phascolarctobacterium sp.]
MARRAKGEGSLYFDEKRQSWRWHGYYINQNGEKKFKNFYAKKQSELKKKVDAFLKQNNENEYVDKNISVAQWIEIWLESFVKPTVKLTTYGIYQQKMFYVISAFGNKPLYCVNGIEFQKFLNELHLSGGSRNQGLSAATVNSVRRYFKICCNVAVENGVIIKNPILVTKPIRKKRTEITVLTENEVKLMLQIAKEGNYVYEGISNKRFLNFNEGTKYLINCYYALIKTALSTGMRIGELRGLVWDCIYFSRKYIEVKRQLVNTGNALIFDEPKTSYGKRKIVIDDSLITELVEFKNYQEKYKEALGNHFKNDSNLVFTNTFGSPIDLHNFRMRYFNKILKAANINPSFTIHCMRHTHASILLKNGVNIKVVSERLGHSTVTITLNTYAHILENMEYTASNTWASIINT